jgi:hypothetical protein
MSKPADKEAISLQLQETIEKLEEILVQVKANPKQNYPSATLLRRLADATESLQGSVAKPSLVKKLSPLLATILLLVVLGGGIYFYNLNRANLTQVAQAPIELSEQEPVEQVEPNQVSEQEPPVIAQEEEEEEEEETIADQEVALTPEQTFLAGIKQSISSYNSQLHDELIASVKVDFERSFLQVKLEPLWYELSDVQQDRLADDIWRHAKDMAFAKIELADGDGATLARSPVVGKDMVILQRTKA